MAVSIEEYKYIFGLNYKFVLKTIWKVQMLLEMEIFTI